MSPSTDVVAAALRSTPVVEPPSVRPATPSGWTEVSVAAGWEPSRRKSERIGYIDMARGLFLILMTSTHAMTLAGIPSTSFLARDRKSTRLNSSHLGISYAVFCLKKKKMHNHYCS